MTDSSLHSLEVIVTSIDDHPQRLSSFIQIRIREGNRGTEFRYLLNCGAALEGGQLRSLSANRLVQHQGLLKNLDGILLTGSSIQECGGLPFLLKHLDEESQKQCNLSLSSGQYSHSSSVMPSISKSCRTNEEEEDRKRSSERVENCEDSYVVSSDLPLSSTNTLPLSYIPPIYCTDPIFQYGKLQLYDVITHLNDIDNCQVEITENETRKSHNIPTTNDQNSISSPVVFHTSTIQRISNSGSSWSQLPSFNGSCPVNIQPVSKSISLDYVDTIFEKCCRLRYRESFFFKKKGRCLVKDNQGTIDWNASTEGSESSSQDEDIEITLIMRGYPSGHCLGGVLWFMFTCGEQSSVILSQKFSTSPNWLYTGLNCLQLPKPPSIMITSCPFLLNPSKFSPIDLPQLGDSCSQSLVTQISSKFPSVPPSIDVSCPRYLISATRRTLQQGGSVLIPVDISSSTLKLLYLFETSWSPVLRAYPIIFVTPTGSVLLDFAKTLLSWMSPSILDSFSITRKNPFHNFQYITTVTSPIQALNIAPNIPSVFISTPSSLQYGFTRKLFLEICSNRESLVLFPHLPQAFESSLFPTLSRTPLSSPSPVILSVKELQSRTLPPDRLYERYLEEQRPNATITETPVNEETDNADLQTSSVTVHRTTASDVALEKLEWSQNTTDIIDTRLELSDNEAELEFSALIKAKMSYCEMPTKQNMDAYGEPLKLWADFNSDVQKRSQQSGGTDIWASGVSAKRFKHLRFSEMFEGVSVHEDATIQNTIDTAEKEDRTIEIVEETKSDSPNLPAWRRQLRQLHNGQDPMETVLVCYTREVLCQAACFPEAFKSDAIIEPFNTYSFAEWAVTSIRPLKAKKLILLPTSFHPDFLQVLLRPGFLNNPVSPEVILCRPQPPQINDSAQPLGPETLVTTQQHSGDYTHPRSLMFPNSVGSAKVEWHELIVDLDPQIWNMLKSRSNGKLHPTFKDIPTRSVLLAKQNDPKCEAESQSSEKTKTMKSPFSDLDLQKRSAIFPSSVQRWQSTLDLMYLELMLTEDVGRKDLNRDENQRDKAIGVVKPDESTDNIEKASSLKLPRLSIFNPSVSNSKPLRTRRRMSSEENLSDEGDETCDETEETYKNSEKWASPHIVNLAELPCNLLHENASPSTEPRNCQWMLFGHTTAQDLYEMASELFIDAKLMPNGISVCQSSINVAINQQPSRQALLIDGGLEASTFLLRKILSDKLVQTGSFFDSSMGNNKENADDATSE